VARHKGEGYEGGERGGSSDDAYWVHVVVLCFVFPVSGKSEGVGIKALHEQHPNEPG
jgi:hypothetical protein